MFVSNGLYEEFVGLWLNGEQLVDGVDFTKVSGSTRMTIRSQTFQNKGKSGVNTIAAEFRTGNTKVLKRTAQNFQISEKIREGIPITAARQMLATEVLPAMIQAAAAV